MFSYFSFNHSIHVAIVNNCFANTCIYNFTYWLRLKIIMTINGVITGNKIFKKTKWRQSYWRYDIYNRGDYIKFTGTKQLIKGLYIYIFTCSW